MEKVTGEEAVTLENSLEVGNEPELSEEELKEYKEKAEALAKQYNVSKVNPIVMIDKETLRRVVAYVKEPSYDVKVRVMDKVQQIGLISAGEELRKACTLVKESDPLTYGESSECDKYKLCVVEECMSLINKSINQFKKKSTSSR